MTTHHANFTDVAANCFWNGLYRESALVEIVNKEGTKYLCAPIRDGKLIIVEVLSESNTGINRYSPSIELHNSRGDYAETLSFQQACELIIANEDIAGSIDVTQRNHFLGAVSESHRNTWVALEQYGQSLGEQQTSFEESEQSLYVGHSLHPAPKSRSNLSFEISQQLSPELKANFALRWFAVSNECVFGGAVTGSDWREYVKQLQVSETALPNTAKPYLNSTSWQVIPMHPWQATQLLTLPQVQELIASGKLVDLGLGQSTWFATSSTRAIYNPTAPFMLKFSLSVKLTNSIRLLSEKEVKRGTALAGICQSLSDDAKKYFANGLSIIHEPSYFGLKDSKGEVIDESLATVRDNPFVVDDQQSMKSHGVLATLCQQTPYKQSGYALSNELLMLAQNNQTDAETLATQWFEAFCDNVVVPIFELQSQLGIVLLAHQQNIVVELEQGMPTKGYFRDCQGVGFTKLAFEHFPQLGSPETTENYWDRAKVNRYFPYYLILNSCYGVIASLSPLVEESLLFELLKQRLTQLYQSAPADTDCLHYVLNSDTLCCKGNFYCYLQGFNENSIPDPSVIYFELPNYLSR
ncbi:IucA/IucC family protein [Vibrio barjaei]|uniref:IucA/IucC family protein n=1 Tax=Vibrio barjaei TaxID=1676683 RepID=A0ABW7IPN5_9VIBR